jgi:peptide/nickel transport system ATP-binding protein/oligopeptide transport system ATP-binding protein
MLRAVDGVSFNIAEGNTLGLVGESGCGKTTLGRTILRLVEATSGRVWFDGVDVLAASGSALRRLRRNMQLVFQDVSGSLNPRLRVGQSVAEPLAIHGIGSAREQRDRVAELLERVGLDPDAASAYPHEFSGGQRQRIGIARAIALEPKLLICDEPVSALDVSVQSQILNLLKDLQRELSLTYLFIAHDLAVVKHVSDYVAVMYLGKVVEIAKCDDLYTQPAHPYTVSLLAAHLEPDANREPRRAVAGGEPPSPLAPPTGCAFHPRCSFAAGECRQSTPALKGHPTLPPEHHAACYRVDAVRDSARLTQAT